MTSAPKVGLRPFLPADVPLLASIYIASIEQLADDDYSDAQRAAWAAVGDDEKAFAKKFEDRLALVATLDGAPAGFATLEGTGHIDMLYVHPQAARKGVASALVDAMEKLAAARGAKTISVDASDTAQSLFARRGYENYRRNTVPVEDEWLGNTTMRKALAGPEKGASS